MGGNWRALARLVMAEPRFSPDDGATALRWEAIVATADECRRADRRRAAARKRGL
jgi:hypothetical protein